MAIEYYYGGAVSPHKNDGCSVFSPTQQQLN